MGPHVHYSSTDGENFSNRYKVVEDESFDNIVILDGVPIIDNSRREKLLTKISKEFAKRGSTISPNELTVPWDDTAGKSKGYVHIPSLKFILTPNLLDMFSWNSRLAKMPSTLSTL